MSPGPLLMGTFQTCKHTFEVKHRNEHLLSYTYVLYMCTTSGTHLALPVNLLILRLPGENFERVSTVEYHVHVHVVDIYCTADSRTIPLHVDLLVPHA